ncbi:hypothetical protein BDN72DRAFT_901242 [Pluteus cervinus]|uniref:Uncharacterized protein n=1 Tax=Pluteus cervinus TaxID=181527 RepID=A0ACD3AFX9_9AGAR|nr:hypothetical protein BDN72DRAFT_901242 [Pluteus cervinus]
MRLSQATTLCKELSSAYTQAMQRYPNKSDAGQRKEWIEQEVHSNLSWIIPAASVSSAVSLAEEAMDTCKGDHHNIQKLLTLVHPWTAPEKRLTRERPHQSPRPHIPSDHKQQEKPAVANQKRTDDIKHHFSLIPSAIQPVPRPKGPTTQTNINRFFSEKKPLSKSTSRESPIVIDSD